jgi:hypothetical protein
MKKRSIISTLITNSKLEPICFGSNLDNALYHLAKLQKSGEVNIKPLETVFVFRWEGRPMCGRWELVSARTYRSLIRESKIYLRSRDYKKDDWTD